jgi:transposase
MGEVSTIGLDLAKNVFQVHGADASGAVLFRKKLRRHQVLAFFSSQPPCTVAMEACGSAHHWAREITKLGHTVRLIPPAYVKPFEALRGLDERIASLDHEIAQRPKENEAARRLMTIPGVGPVIAVALAALAPPAETFKCGRDFAAWVGFTPLQHSPGGKQKLGATSKMGERTLRRLLIIGANSVLLQVARMIARKPPMLVRVALANKMARIVWALLARGEVYRAPAAAA